MPSEIELKLEERFLEMEMLYSKTDPFKSEQVILIPIFYEQKLERGVRTVSKKAIEVTGSKLELNNLLISKK